MPLREISPMDRIFPIRGVETEQRVHTTQARETLADCTSRRAQSEEYSFPGRTSLRYTKLHALNGILKQERARNVDGQCRG